MIELSIKRPLIVFVLFSIIALLGIVTFKLLNINLMPKFETNVITITTIYPGASASEVETSVSKKIEDALSSLENLDKIKTVSQEGVSSIVLQLKSAANPTVSVEDAQRKVNAILSDLPTDVKAPTISKFALDELPIISIAVTADMDPTTLYKLTEDKVQPRLAKLQGVGQITLVGGNKREIRVNIDPERLKAYNLSILQVLQAIQKANQDFPTGKVEETDKQYTVRLSAKYNSLEQLKNTAITVGAEGNRILVKDVAEIQDGMTDQEELSRLNKKTSIGIQVKKQTDANTVEVARLVKEEMKQIEKEYTSENLKYEIASDSSTFTMDSVNAVVEDLVLAILIVSFICLIFLHSLRSALVVMVAVPLSMLPAFIFLYLFGYSLNVMSLMALSLAVGILVDDSIVVVENIHRHLEMGKGKVKAALEGSKQIVATAASITLVIVVVFLPLAISGGLVGKILQEFAFPLIVSTLTSLLVSFTLTPLLQSKFGKMEDLSRDTVANKFSRGVEAAFNKLKSLYESVLRWGLEYRKTVFALVVVLFIGSLGLFAAGLIGAAFIPNTDQGEFIVEMEMAPQISVYENNLLAQKAENLLLSKPEITKVFTNVGTSSNMLSSTAKNNITQMTVSMVEKNKRKISVEDYSQIVRTELSAMLPGVKVRVSPTSIAGGAGNSPIQIQVKGADLDKVEQGAAIVKAIVLKTPGTSDVKYSIDDPKPEIQVQINRDKMAQLGLSIYDVGATLRTSLAGNTDSKYKDGNYEYDINIKFDKFDKQNLDDVSKITFLNDKGQLIELKQFADVSQSVGPSMLERNDRITSITVNSNVVGRPTGTVSEEISKAIKGKLPQGVSIEDAGSIKQQNEAFSSLLFSLIAAIILVYLIMVALYNSLLYPFVVLFSIPVAMIGSFMALALTMENLTIFSIVGLITLIGLVAKNAILIVDFTNNLRAEGKELKEALIEAGKERLRPILMTTLAMVFGMLPIAIATGAGAEIKNGMAWVIIGGLTSSLLLTLILVPAVYLSLENLATGFRAKQKAKKEKELETEGKIFEY
jgi:hydrophobic/amphiphilic exporter-1 (mainly G- bacteria), HAE1 family